MFGKVGLGLLTCSVIAFGVFLSGAIWADNCYFFEPETLIVGRGDPFEWHLMLETDEEVCGYGFAVDVVLGDVNIFDTDTLSFDWTGSAADSGNLGVQVGPEFSPDEDWFGGAATALKCPPGLAKGSHIAITILGTVSETAPVGVYEFTGPHAGKTCDFVGVNDKTSKVSFMSGHLKVIEELYPRPAKE